MLQLRVFGDADALADLSSWLKASALGEHTVLVPAHDDVGNALLIAEVPGESAQRVLARLDALGIQPNEIALLRIDNMGPVLPGARSASLIWPDMVGLARRNSRPVSRYLVFMAVAGVIAGYGVLTINDTLIVGAMAVSPDTLPIVAACVGIVGRQWLLASRSVGTLALGMAVTAITAGLTAVSVRVTHHAFHFAATSPGLAGLVTVGVGTIGVALAAGVAAMIALETRSSSAVGVAISVTTIPAAAYFGVAFAEDEYGKAGGALEVLGINIAMLLIGGTITLLLQRWLYRRKARPSSTVNHGA
ncbi:MAG TPA: DUF389 domain-containing protein [Micromonosporaceae bacterium]|nr:DUF389 domain-containing protein [Micromonosporaceae bacterium]